MTMLVDWVSGALPFRIGRFEGAGHWVNQQAEGDYAVRYTITDLGNGVAHHAVRREFFTPDGSSVYVEETTAVFTPEDRNRMGVVITGPKGSVTGGGYVFGNQCHYEADIAPGTRLEFTFTVVDSRRIDALASSAHGDKVTCWREQLSWVGLPADPAQEYTSGSQEALP